MVPDGRAGLRDGGVALCYDAAMDSSRGLARHGTAWVATATAAATVWALRALRRQYGNGVGLESKKVSRR